MDLIVTHSNTDFDGLAAQLAAQKLYPHALPVLHARLRDNVAEFDSPRPVAPLDSLSLASRGAVWGSAIVAG